MEMERKAKEEDQGALALVLECAKAFERVSLLVVWAWATHSSFLRKILRVLCGYFPAPEAECSSKDVVAEPLQTITAILPRENVFFKGLKLAVNENGKEGKSKMIASCGFSGRRTASMQQGKRSDGGRQCGNAGSRLENQSQEFGSERKSEKNEVQSEILAYQEEQSLPEELHEGGVKKLLRAGMVPARTWWSPCSRDGSHGKVEIEEADGSSSGQKGHDLSVLVHGSIWPCSGRKSSLPWPLSIGHKEYGQGNGVTIRKKHS